MQYIYLYYNVLFMQASKPSIFPILLVNFIGTLGYSIVLPFLVMLVLSLGGNELVYGVLGATYSAFQFIGAPILGDLSDRYGRKKLLIISEAGTFIAWLIFLLALLLPNSEKGKHNDTLWVVMHSMPLLLLFAGRALDGLTGGNISIANAYLADISTHEERKKNFGIMAASANLGLIFGPALAGILGATAWGNLLPILLAAFISLVAILVIVFDLRDVQPRKIEKTLQEDSSKLPGQLGKECYTLKKEKRMGLADVLKLKHIPFLLLLYFLIFLAFNFFYIAFPVYVAQQLHWSVFDLGIFFSVLSAVLVVVEGPVMGRISNKFSEAALVIAGSILLAIGFIFFRSSNYAMIYGGALFFSLGNGIMWPSFLAIVANAADDRYQGTIQGFANSAGSLASIIGLVSGAFLYKALQSNIFLLATLFMGLITILSFRLIKIDK